MKKFLSRFYVALVFAFLYLPIAVLVIYSFNESKGTLWTGFSFKWYIDYFTINLDFERFF